MAEKVYGSRTRTDRPRQKRKEKQDKAAVGQELTNEQKTTIPL